MPRHLTRAEIGRGGSRHRAPRVWVRGALLALVAVLAVGGATVLLRPDALHGGQIRPPQADDATAAGAASTGTAATTGAAVAAAGTGCAPLSVTSTAGFVPVLTAVKASLATGPGCSTLRITPADGRTAASSAASSGAEVWITDDTSWAGAVPAGFLAEGATPTIVATSPVHVVADQPSATLLRRAGGTWRALADLTGRAGGLRLVVADPGSSGVGLVAAGGLGEAVWLGSGMDASAAALARSFEHTRTVATATEILPIRSGEVALMSEQSLLAGRAQLRPGDVVLALRDRTALLRFGLFPTARALADPAKAAAVRRLQSALTGAGGGPLDPVVAGALDDAGLRRPGDPASAGAASAGAASAGAASAGAVSAGAVSVGAAPGGAGAAVLPVVTAAPFEVLKPHHVDHVFAVWYPEARRANALLVVDVSASMGNRLPGGGTLIQAARRGSNRVADVLPDQSVLGVWEFGSRLDGARDYRALVPAAPLTTAHRAAVRTALGGLGAQDTGTGLYDTILAAYGAVGRTDSPGVPSHVLVFTDGRNGSDPNSISLSTLTTRLVAAAKGRPATSIVVLTYGVTEDAAALNTALAKIGGAVISVRTEQEVEAAFMHFAAGGLHPQE